MSVRQIQDPAVVSPLPVQPAVGSRSRTDERSDFVEVLRGSLPASAIRKPDLARIASPRAVDRPASRPDPIQTRVGDSRESAASRAEAGHDESYAGDAEYSILPRLSEEGDLPVDERLAVADPRDAALDAAALEAAAILVSATVSNPGLPTSAQNEGEEAASFGGGESAGLAIGPHMEAGSLKQALCALPPGASESVVGLESQVPLNEASGNVADGADSRVSKNQPLGRVASTPSSVRSDIANSQNAAISGGTRQVPTRLRGIADSTVGQQGISTSGVFTQSSGLNQPRPSGGFGQVPVVGQDLPQSSTASEQGSAMPTPASSASGLGEAPFSPIPSPTVSNSVLDSSVSSRLNSLSASVPNQNPPSLGVLPRVVVKAPVAGGVETGLISRSTVVAEDKSSAGPKSTQAASDVSLQTGMNPLRDADLAALGRRQNGFVKAVSARESSGEVLQIPAEKNESVQSHGTGGASEGRQVMQPPSTNLGLNDFASNSNSGSERDGSFFLGGNTRGMVDPMGAPAVQNGNSSASAAHNASPAAEVSPTDVWDRIREMIQRVRSENPSHLSVEVRLNDGASVGIELRMRPTGLEASFRSESTALLRGLESQWAGFLAQEGPGLQIASAAFENRSSLGHFSDSGRNGRELREQMEDNAANASLSGRRDGKPEERKRGSQGQ